ncbi:putative 4-hydroxy-4-methyl-2-oxoglutarate aldolase 2 isoform X3 [Salvia splendens]|uniref:putative 4-hydroxy-4-methyl-2-oxoglutarate aldolase 2 isoform X3 n=1 Tax=Salvia splendens TaxID=180675 RepID=UPI001C2623C7|nr:putative 4-hydroxy-4-methyl-2-oxoglutarate aldolase 2 isoform X3 [Salvia splendens]
MAQKVVVRLLTTTDEKTKQKAIEAAADILERKEEKCAGVDSISADVKEQKVTVVGDMDAVAVVKRLKKVGKLDIVSVGPATEEEVEEKVQANKMALVTTAELCDANPQYIMNGELRALLPKFKIYGQRQVFYGQVVTLRVFEDNVLVREFLEEKGDDRVLVVDGGGSLRCAILGGNPVVQAQNNGWAGIIVNGCIRDVDEINGCDIGVRALSSHPMKASKKGLGEKHLPVHFGGTRICDGEWLYADTDGILVSKSELSV